MKKFITAAAALVALFLAGCTAQTPQPTDPTQTQTQTQESSTQATKKPNNPAYGEVKVQEETIKKVVTKKKPAKPQATETIEETEETKNPEPTAPATMPPTQGVTKPSRTIVVTTVKGSFSPEDLDFIYGSEVIKLNDKVEEVFKKLGDDSYEKPAKKTNKYDFEDFVLNTYVEDGIERVDKITISKGNYSTAKGAQIGMYASRLRRIYGDESKLTDTYYFFGSGTKKLIFTYEDNVVTGIIYKLYH